MTKLMNESIIQSVTEVFVEQSQLHRVKDRKKKNNILKVNKVHKGKGADILKSKTLHNLISGEKNLSQK